MQARLRILASASVVALTAVAGSAQTALTDTVGTLPLSAELDSRGNLGGVTVDRLGFLYVANFRDAVWRISPEGEVELVARSQYGSSGNAVDSRGDLFQANFFADTIDRITRTGEVERFADEGLAGPVGLVFGDDGTLYACNCNGNFIATVDRDGVVERLAESDLFACPNGIVFGPDGHLYVTNFNNHDLIRVTKEGEVSRFTTVPGGAGNAHLTFSKGFFFVTKILANQVVKVSMAGEVFPVAGSGQVGHDDGPGDVASFAHPNGIAVSPTGDVLYLNTLVGEFRTGKPGRMTVRTIELTTLTDVLESALEEGGLEALASAHALYSADPVRGQEDTIAEMVALGYSLLSGGRPLEGLEVFRLNATAHPEAALAQYQFGEANRYLGQVEAAVEQYRKTLAIEADHALASSRLVQLGAE